MLFHIKSDLNKLNLELLLQQLRSDCRFAYSSSRLVMFKRLIHPEEWLITSLWSPYLVMKSHHFWALACNSLWIVRRLNLVFLGGVIGLCRKAHAKIKQRSSCRIIHFDFGFVLRATLPCLCCALLRCRISPIILPVYILPTPSQQPGLTCWLLAKCDTWPLIKHDGQLSQCSDIKETCHLNHIQQTFSCCGI